MSDNTSPAPRRENYGWVYFFIFVFGAGILVALIMIWFTRSIQLTPELLEAAKKRWQESKITDYNLTYKKKLNDDDWMTFRVKFRKDKVQEVLMNGKPLQTEGEQDPLPYHSMDAYFRFLERFLDIDQKPDAPKVYFVADFDQKTGAIIRFTRYNRSDRQRVEMIFIVEILGK
jgi:hypothetical protein